MDGGAGSRRVGLRAAASIAAAVALAVAVWVLARGWDGGAWGGRGAGRLRLATTTSTENSGLLDRLLPAFEEATGIHVDVIAVGSGAALRLGAAGEVDALLVHAPEGERKFVQAGDGVGRVDVMYNDFVIVGPPEDPAGVRGCRGAAEGLAAVARAGAPFYSRDDDSGTHRKELAIWREAGLDPSRLRGGWYRGTGQGMGATLLMADEGRGYCLSDRGTYLALRDRLDLEVVLEGDPRLHNPYGAMAVNPLVHPGVRIGEARAFLEWIVSPEGRGIIEAYRIDGEPVFHPAGGDRR